MMVDSWGKNSESPALMVAMMTLLESDRTEPMAAAPDIRMIRNRPD